MPARERMPTKSHYDNITVEAQVSGADGAILDGADSNIKATVQDLANSNPLNVAIVDSSGDQIASFGGGTQYDDGDADATPTGTVAMGTDGSNVFAITTDTDGHQQVDVLSSALPTGAATAANQQTDALTDTELRANPVPISGTITAELSTTDNTVLDAIQTATEATQASLETVGGQLVNLGSNNDVTLATLPDTSAGDLAAINSSTDGIEALLTTIDSDTGNLPTIETNTDFGTVVGGGTETGALRVTIANNSTGVISVDDNGSSLTVDGTVTANLSTTDNAVLDEIASSIHSEDTAHSSGDNGTFILAVRNDDLATSYGADQDYYPIAVNSRGAVYIDVANGGVLESAIDEIETLLGTIDSDTSTLAGAVSGSEMQVDVVTMPTVTVQATDLDIRALTNTDVVTAELSSTDNAVLDTIATNTGNHAVTNAGTFAVQEDGALLDELRILNGSYAMQVAVDSGDSTITYQGWAVPGTATTGSTWRIRRITDDGAGNVSIDWEDGDRSFDNQWSTREAGSYS